MLKLGSQANPLGSIDFVGVPPSPLPDEASRRLWLIIKTAYRSEKVREGPARMENRAEL